MDLNTLKCTACRGDEPPLSKSEAEKYLGFVTRWNIKSNPTRLEKEFEFENFKRALSFVNKVGGIAEEEGHHPNVYLYDYKKVRIELWTHKISGLHQNDFIVATKIDHIKS